jgi:HK97 family phage portal protein
MGFFKFFAGLVGISPRPNPMEERFWRPDGGGADFSRAGEYVSADTIQQLDAVAACLLALAGPLSTLPIGIFERAEGAADDGISAQGVVLPQQSEEAEPQGYKSLVADHPVAKLFNLRPNDRQTSQEFRDEQLRHLAIWRNSYALLTQDRKTGQIGSMELIHPQRVTKVERNSSSGKVEYTITRIGAVGSEVLTSDLIWHVRMAPLTLNGLQGRPIFETSREVFGRALAVKNYGSDWFKNSGQSGGVLKHPGSFKSKEEQEKFMAGWRWGSTGANRHKDRLLQYGVEYQPFSVANDQAQFIETERESALAICRLFNMPPHRAGILDRATFSNIEQQSLDFIIFTIAPYVAAIEQSIWRDLIVDPEEQDELTVEINLSALLRGDILTRYKAYAIGRQWGWLSVNDILRLENQRPVPGGDRYLEPTNMVEAGKAGEAGEPGVAGAQPDKSAPSDQEEDPKND